MVQTNVWWWMSLFFDHHALDNLKHRVTSYENAYSTSLNWNQVLYSTLYENVTKTYPAPITYPTTTSEPSSTSEGLVVESTVWVTVPYSDPEPTKSITNFTRFVNNTALQLSNYSVVPPTTLETIARRYPIANVTNSVNNATRYVNTSSSEAGGYWEENTVMSTVWVTVPYSAAETSEASIANSTSHVNASSLVPRKAPFTNTSSPKFPFTNTTSSEPAGHYGEQVIVTETVWVTVPYSASETTSVSIINSTRHANVSSLAPRGAPPVKVLKSGLPKQKKKALKIVGTRERTTSSPSSTASRSNTGSQSTKTTKAPHFAEFLTRFFHLEQRKAPGFADYLTRSFPLEQRNAPVSSTISVPSETSESLNATAPAETNGYSFEEPIVVEPEVWRSINEKFQNQQQSTKTSKAPGFADYLTRTFPLEYYLTRAFPLEQRKAPVSSKTSISSETSESLDATASAEKGGYSFEEPIVVEPEVWRSINEKFQNQQDEAERSYVSKVSSTSSSLESLVLTSNVSPTSEVALTSSPTPTAQTNSTSSQPPTISPTSITQSPSEIFPTTTSTKLGYTGQVYGSMDDFYSSEDAARSNSLRALCPSWSRRDPDPSIGRYGEEFDKLYVAYKASVDSEVSEFCKPTPPPHTPTYSLPDWDMYGFGDIDATQSLYSAAQASLSSENEKFWAEFDAAQSTPQTTVHHITTGLWEIAHPELVPNVPIVSQPCAKSKKKIW